MTSNSLSHRASRGGEASQTTQNAATYDSRGIWPWRHAQTTHGSKSYAAPAHKLPASNAMVHRCDAKMLMWIVPHAVVPLALWSLDALPVGHISNLLRSIDEGPVLLLIYILIQATVGILYHRLYGSNPGQCSCFQPVQSMKHAYQQPHVCECGCCRCELMMLPPFTQDCSPTALGRRGLHSSPASSAVPPPPFVPGTTTSVATACTSLTTTAGSYRQPLVTSTTATSYATLQHS